MNCCQFNVTMTVSLEPGAMSAVNGTLVAPLRPHCNNDDVFGVAVEVGEDIEMGHEDEEACATLQDDHQNTCEVLRSGP